LVYSVVRKGVGPVSKPVVTVKVIGYWRDEYEPQWPDPRAFVDASWEQSERDAVARYLETGGFVPWWMLGYSECRFCGIVNGDGERCDGVYIWPQGLPHYIREHDVRLPGEVVEHILSEAKSPDQDALRRARAALTEDGQRLLEAEERAVKGGLGWQEPAGKSFVIDNDYWAQARLG
jgi:hypothetical protein